MTTPIPHPAPVAPSTDFNSVDFAAKMKSLGVDSKQEEDKLRGVITKLVLFAKGSPGPVRSFEQDNSVLVIPPSGWSALIADFPEKSFRADFNRAVRSALGLLAVLEEEMAFYRVRCTSEHLWQPHLRSLLFLAWRSQQILPELECMAKEARDRGLSQKADDATAMIDRLSQLLQEIAAIDIAQIKEESDGVGLDPQWIEGQVVKMMAQLEAAVMASSEEICQVPLPHSILALSASEREAFLSDCSEAETSFRADLNRMLRRAVGLIASMQEELALYGLTSTAKHRWQMHLKSLSYLAYQAGQVLPQAEKLAQEVSRRGLSAKAADVKAVVARLHNQVREISELRQHRTPQTSAAKVRAAAAGTTT
ncbi:MAG: hypothetical protein HY649_00755 [Acidobacteria bacterium]|nr:hypothetical protein [Acidobacteriota bacterium]